MHLQIQIAKVVGGRPIDRIERMAHDVSTLMKHGMTSYKRIHARTTLSHRWL